jgi:hypothetical protein
VLPNTWRNRRGVHTDQSGGDPPLTRVAARECASREAMSIRLWYWSAVGFRSCRRQGRHDSVSRRPPPWRLGSAPPSPTSTAACCRCWSTGWPSQSRGGSRRVGAAPAGIRERSPSSAPKYRARGSTTTWGGSLPARGSCRSNVSRRNCWDPPLQPCHSAARPRRSGRPSWRRHQPPWAEGVSVAAEPSCRQWLHRRCA